MRLIIECDPRSGGLCPVVAYDPHESGLADYGEVYQCEECGHWTPIPRPPAVVDPDKPLLCPACEGSVI